MTKEQALADLRSTRCRCGGAKRALQALCPNCYFQLPSPERMALYRPLGGGFEEAYDIALDILGHA
jgi:hypothetical protein